MNKAARLKPSFNHIDDALLIWLIKTPRFYFDSVIRDAPYDI